MGAFLGPGLLPPLTSLLSQGTLPLFSFCPFQMPLPQPSQKMSECANFPQLSYSQWYRFREQRADKQEKQISLSVCAETWLRGTAVKGNSKQWLKTLVNIVSHNKRL